METRIRELESFCESFLASNKTDEIKRGEDWLADFRERASIDDYCIVLTLGRNEFLIFESLKAFTKILILKWNIYNSEEREMLKSKLVFLLNWSLDNRDHIPHYIWTAAINSVVKMIKKAYSEDVTDVYDLFTEKIMYFINSNAYESKKLGLELINCFLDVFSGNGSIVQQVRISKDAEMKLRQDFEKNKLLEMCTHLLNLMAYIEQNSNQNYDQLTFDIMKLIVSNLEIIFSWNFINRASIKWIMLPQNEVCKRFSPPPKWSSIIQDFSIIELLFKIHGKMRFKDGTTTLTCLILLAGLRVKFRHNSCENFPVSPTPDSDGDLLNMNKNSYNFSRNQYSFAFIDYLYDFYACRINNSHNSNIGNNNETDSSLYLYDYEVPLLGELLYHLQEHLTSSVWLDGLTLHCIDSKIELNQRRDFPKDVAREFARHVVTKISKFIELYTIFLVKCIEGAAMENLSPSETIYTEASDRILSRFVSFTNFREYLQYTTLERRSSQSTMFPGFIKQNINSPTSADFMSSSAWEKMVFEELVTFSSHCHRRLFQCFLKAHLAAPDGFRNVSVDCDVIIIESDDSSDDLNLEVHEDDKKLYEGSLYAAGFSALECIEDSVCDLTNLIHQRLYHLDSVISSSNVAPFSLLEDIHWLISISGFTILNVVDDVLTSSNFVFHHLDTSDQKLIYQHSRQQLKAMLQSMSSGSENRDEAALTQQIVSEYRTLLMDCTRDICAYNDLQNFRYHFSANLSQCDDIIRLFLISLRGFALVLRGCNSGQVVTDFIWLFNRWMIGYMQINEQKNSEMDEITVLAVFHDQQVRGESNNQTNNGGLICRSQIINTMLYLINICVGKWNHDPSVMDALVTLLYNITYSIPISKLLHDSQLWKQKMTQMIVRIDPPYSLIRNDFLSKFVTAVMNVAISCDTEQQLNDYLQILDPIAHRFMSLLSPNSPNVPSRDFESEFVCCLSLLHGIITTKWPSRLSRLQQQKTWAMGYNRLFITLFPWLEQCILIICNPDYVINTGKSVSSLLSKPQGILLFKPAIVQGLLECILEISKTVLLELDYEQTVQFYTLNLRMFQLYSNKFKHQGSEGASNDITSPIDATGPSTEEDTINEMRLLFSIASELLSRTMFDEFDFDSSAPQSSNIVVLNRALQSLMGYDVIAQMIMYLAPFMTMEILEIPEVGTVFFQCATLITEFRPASFLVNMNYDFNAALVKLYLENLKNSNRLLLTYIFRGLTALAEFYYNNNERSPQPNISISEPSSSASLPQNLEICNFDMDLEFQTSMVSVMRWIRSHYVTAEIIDYASSFLIVLYKYNEDVFYQQINAWLSNVNTEYVTHKTDELIYAIDNKGVSKRLKNVAMCLNQSKHPHDNWSSSRWMSTHESTSISTDEGTGEPVSSFNVIPQYNNTVTKWNELIMHINDYLDSYFSDR